MALGPIAPDSREAGYIYANCLRSSDKDLANPGRTIHDELWQRSLAAIGLKVEFPKQQWSEQLKAASEGKLQIWSVGASSDNSDYYMLQFYGPSAGNANLPRFRNAEFDELFRKSRRVRGDAERAQIYAKMTDILGGICALVPGGIPGIHDAGGAMGGGIRKERSLRLPTLGVPGR